MVFFSRSLLAVAALVGLWASSAPARAQNPNVSLSEINAALKNIPPQSGRFEQSLPNGNMARGTYHMQWPARLRFAYEGANDGGSIVTVKGKFVAVQEKPGAEPNWFPVSLTPLSVLRQAVRDGITQDMVRARDDSDSVIALTLHDPKGELPGVALGRCAKSGDTSPPEPNYPDRSVRRIGFHHRL
jgi:hypothetical protein